MLIEVHMNIIVNHACPMLRILIMDNRNIIVNHTCPYSMMIGDHINIIVNHTCVLLPHADRRSYEHHS